MEEKTTDTTLECEVCLREIPNTVANNAEADEYVAYYCGLECYSKWAKNNQNDT
ncbi:MAG: DUF3330 domain-containing protein [Gammaproteobacteria bacterium]|nr:DUF3330 domain-containing protein [Gammaproteobacteria bacterium]